MKALLRVDGHLGCFTKEVEMDDNIAMHATRVTLLVGANNVGFDRTALEYSEEGSFGIWKATFYHFIDKEEAEDFNLSDNWTPEEGGFLEGVRKVRELMDKMK